MATNKAIALVLTAAFLAAAACSGSSSTPDPEVRADVGRRLDVVDRVAPADVVEHVDLAEETEVCLCPICEPFKPECKEGEAKCTYANTQVKYCKLDDYGCGFWTDPEPCPDNTICQTPGGCVCKFGACQQGDDLASLCGGQILTGCDTWACSDGCCVVGKVQNCCEKNSECADCINLETGEHLTPCPEEPTVGFVYNQCTIDACIQGKCEHVPVDCDDGDSCTQDECDPVTGACFNPGDECLCCLTPCWGETQQEADAKCDDGNACTAQECDYGDEGFIPWIGLDPEDPNLDALEAGIGVCVFNDLSDGCVDNDPCTINGCDPVKGCTKETDIVNPDCACENDADCEDVDDNPCTINKCYLEENFCYILDYECDDDCLMTDDVCDPTVPEGEDPCVYLPCQACPSVVPWEELVCLSDEDCDPSCAHPQVWDDPEYGCCLDIFCNFPLGEEYGSCAAAEKNCDDNDACTVDSCDCSYGPFSATCVHEVVPDC